MIILISNILPLIFFCVGCLFIRIIAGDLMTLLFWIYKKISHFLYVFSLTLKIMQTGAAFMPSINEACYVIYVILSMAIKLLQVTLVIVYISLETALNLFTFSLKFEHTAKRFMFLWRVNVKNNIFAACPCDKCNSERRSMKSKTYPTNNICNGKT